MRNLMLVLPLFAVGCSPLQQAPLMYTSKQIFGVDISAPTTESTGVTMSIGFKSVDAAYVPIAVSKEGTEVKIVNATYGSSDGAQGPSTGDLQVSRVNALKVAILSEQTAQSNLKSANDELTAAQQYNAYISAGNTEQAQNLVTSSVFKSSNLSRHSGFTTLNKEIPSNDIAGLKSALIGAEESLKKATSDVDITKKELAELLYVQRNDAMSVYGSFGATTNGDSGSLSNKLGKVFSTGVAAQNLTEGIAHESEALARGRFLSSCLLLIDSIDKLKKPQLTEDCTRAALYAREP